MTNWTKSQLEAIKHTEGSLVVSAGAGSGKTAVLTQRVIDIISNEENPVSIDELLIVTFTKAAASEMRYKINKRLTDKIRENPKSANLLKQKMLLPNSEICTIDSFCSRVVKDNFSVLEINPNFTLLSNQDEELMQKRIAGEIVDEFYENDNIDFIKLSNLLSNDKNDKNIVDAVIKLYNYSIAYKDPEKWMRDALSKYENNSNEFKDIFIDFIASNIESARRLIDDCIIESSDEKHIKFFQNEMNVLIDFSKAIETKSLTELKKLMINYDFERLPRGVPEILKLKRNKYKDILKSLTDLPICTDEEYISDQSVLYPQIKSIIDAATLLSKRLFEEKKSINSFSFSDVEHLALRALMSGAPSKKYREIFIDEYQDTNELQDTIFSLVSDNENNLFLVGDVKQSIYRFRKAMPEIFISKREKHEEIKLLENFRCDDGIITGVNYIFSKLMSKEIGEVNYKNEELIFGKNKNEMTDTGSNIEFNVIDSCSTSDRLKIEAKLTAERIKELIDEGISPRDICILSRTNKPLPEFSKALTKLDIPVFDNSNDSIFDSYETAVIISLLRVINNPLRDIHLMSVMMSSLFGFSSDEMADIRIKSPKVPLYSAVLNYKDNEKVSDFLNTINEYRMYAAGFPSKDVILKIYSDYDYPETVDNPSNLFALLNLAETFESANAPDIQSFIRYLDSIDENSISTGSSTVISNANNMVNLMTMHGSKGLEFPIVFVVDLAHGFNKKDSYEAMQLNQQLGISLKIKDEQTKNVYDTVQRKALEIKNLYSEMSENIRTLYVALTRAREKLIMFSSYSTWSSFGSAVKRAVPCISNTSDSIFYQDIYSAPNFAFLLLSALLTHQSAGIYQGEDHITKVCDCSIDFKLFNAEDIDLNDENNIKPSEVNIDPDLLKRLQAQITYEYPYKPLSTLEAKYAASHLSEDLSEINEEFFLKSKPAFLSKDSITPSERGTITHKFMELADYSVLEKDVASELSRLKESKFFTEKQAGSIDIKRIQNFISSGLYKRIKASDNVMREKKFALNFSVLEIDGTLDEKFRDETVLIQGIADCIFVEDESLVIVDYKTDNVSTLDELKERYKTQLQIYSKAFEKCLELPVKECILYSFKLNDYIVL